MPGKMKIMYLNLYKLSFSHYLFRWVLTVNSESIYVMNILLRLWKNIPFFLSLLSFRVLDIYASMESINAVKAAAFYGV